jgi:hypothetical protein
VYAECVGKILEIFHRKLSEFNEQKQALAKVTVVTSKPVLASFKVSNRIAIHWKLHLTREILVLLIYVVESYTKEFQKIPLADRTVGRRVLDVS